MSASDERADRLQLAPGVAELLEDRARLGGELDRACRLTSPQGDVGEQHAHDRRGPAVAELGRLLQDPLGEDRGFLEPALREADPREQAERPAHAAPVAELAERARRRIETPFRLFGVAAHERDPREVLQRPRLAAAVADGEEELERLFDVDRRRVRVAAEQARQPAEPERVAEPARVAESAPARDGLVERLRRSREVAFLVLDVAEHRLRGGQRAPVVAALGRGHDHAEVVARARAVPELGARPGAGRRSGQQAVFVVVTDERERVAEVLLGGRPVVAALGPLGRPGQELDAGRDHAARETVDRSELGHERRGDVEVVGEPVEVLFDAVVGLGVLGDELARAWRGDGPAPPSSACRTRRRG